jgi:hypothetical protein
LILNVSSWGKNKSILNDIIFLQVQFAAIITHQLQLLYHDCGYPKWTVPIVVSQNLYMFILFAGFYRKTYLKPAQAKIEKENDNGVHKLNGNGCKPITNGNGHAKHS